MSGIHSIIWHALNDEDEDERHDRLESLGLDRRIANEPGPADPDFWRGVLHSTRVTLAKDEELIAL